MFNPTGLFLIVEIMMGTVLQVGNNTGNEEKGGRSPAGTTGQTAWIGRLERCMVQLCRSQDASASLRQTTTTVEETETPHSAAKTLPRRETTRGRASRVPGAFRSINKRTWNDDNSYLLSLRCPIAPELSRRVNVSTLS